MSAPADHALTPPQVARLWNVCDEHIHVLIRRGLLKAFSISVPGSRKPRWRIHLDAVREYEAAHAARAPAPRQRRRRQAKQEASYF